MYISLTRNLFNIRFFMLPSILKVYQNLLGVYTIPGLIGCPTADLLEGAPLGVNTLVSDNDPVYSSLSQSSAAGKSSPQLPTNDYMNYLLFQQFLVKISQWDIGLGAGQHYLVLYKIST